MPTGSLCAERNVIGSALADDITLKRQDLRIIAVYSAVLPLEDKPVSPRASSSKPVGLESPILCYTARSPASAEVDMSVSFAEGLSEGSAGAEVAGSQSSVVGQKRKIMNIPIKMQTVDSFEESFQVHAEERKITGGLPSTPVGGRLSSRGKAGRGSSYATQDASGAAADSSREASGSAKAVQSSTPKSTSKTRRKSTPFTATISSTSSLDKDLATTVPVLKTIFVDEQDKNPLKPCGACHEWLKKIAEINTKFCVVTFTDANFTGVYIEQIKDD